MTLFERIKLATKKRGKTMRQVAKEAGFSSESALYRYNQGVSPRKPTIEAIARAIPTSVEFLEGKTDDWEIKDNNSSKDNYVADLDSPVYALNGQRITGDLAKDIRDYARFKLSQTKKDNKRDE